jgi:mRNA interferase RelE/StbE
LIKLKVESEKQGKALVDNLSGFRSVRAVGQRYRIVYKVEPAQVLVLVVGVGRRKDGDKKDIYTLLQKLLEE